MLSQFSRFCVILYYIYNLLFCYIPIHILAVKEKSSTISCHKYFSISNTWCLGRIFHSSRTPKLQYLYYARCQFTATRFLIIEIAPSTFRSGHFHERSTLSPNTPKEITTYWLQYFYFETLIRLTCGSTVEIYVNKCRDTCVNLDSQRIWIFDVSDRV
jgi:hypothetical protein